MFIRTATARDIPAIRSLLVETWHDSYDAIYSAEKVTAVTDEWHSIRSLTARLNQPRSEFLVADDGQQLGGMAYAEADETGQTVNLRQLYVRPGQQGRGIGGLLMDEVEDSFPEARRFTLEVEQANAKAVRFYQLRGFVDDGSSQGTCARSGISKTARAMVLVRGAG